MASPIFVRPNMKNILYLLTLSVTSLFAQSIPDGYYNGTAGLEGDQLKLKLHLITRDHKVFDYGDFRDFILPTLDEDPNNPDNILLFYKNNSIPKENFASNNQQDFWNREHTWPKSHGFSSETDTAYTDIHHLRPSDASVNTSKSNKDFDNVAHTTENEEGEAPDTYTNDDFFEPRDDIKGDVARMLFYMDTRYESNALDLELVDRSTYSGDPEIGVLHTLIEWHEQDPVDQYEMDRHELAYGYQQNRNPFIDHPEWVGQIWGTTTGPYLFLDLISFNSDFGQVEVGDAEVQYYTIDAHNLSSNIVLSVDEPFSLSTDSINFSNSLTLAHDVNKKDEDFKVFVKFKPRETGASYQDTVFHESEGMRTSTLVLKGQEGKPVILTIADARQQAIGSVVTIQGIVINTGANNDDNRIIMDATAGIMVRSFDAGNESENLELGDSVQVTGGLSDYNNLLQIEKRPIKIKVLGKNAKLPSPQVISLSQLGESFESELVQVENVAFLSAGSVFAGGGSDGNFTILDSEGLATFRIGSDTHPLVGTEVPSGRVTIEGFVGQYRDSYQISPIDENGIILPPLKVARAQEKATLIYPNPTDGNFHVMLPEQSVDLEVTICNTLGQIVYFESNKLEHNIKSLKSGTYIVVVRSEENVFFQRILKR